MEKTHIGTPLYEVERGGGEFIGISNEQRFNNIVTDL